MGAERSFGKYRKHRIEFKKDVECVADEIKNFCASQGIFEIPLADDALHSLRSVPKYNGLWSNRQHVPDPYACMEEYIDECVRRQNPGNYIVFGMAGHGEMASWAMHLYAVQDNFAYFAQMNWGGAAIELNPEEKTVAQNFVTMMFTTYTHLKAQLEEAIEAGQVSGDGRKLIVVSSNHPRSRVAKCAWLDEDTNSGNIDWRHTTSIFRTPYAVGLSMLSELEEVK